MKPVGILGGMGPEATILLMQKVLAVVPARDDADHIPLIVHQNPQVPSRIAALIEGRGTDPGPILTQMAQDLQSAGAHALAMPCNTAHHYAPQVAQATPLPFFNMLNLTAAALQAQGAQHIGMLASPATRMTGVFETAFASHGLTPVWLDDDGVLLVLIRAVKAGATPDETGPMMRAQSEALIRKGADHLLVACTELSLLTGDLAEGCPWTDSLDCLTHAIVGFAQEAP